jgi:S-adenosylmethionine decarboxylase
MANVIDGLHLVVDGTVRDEIVFSEHHLRELFSALARTLDMEIIDGPRFKRIPVDRSKLDGDRFRDEGGLSAYAMISTSHISVHCWPLRRMFMMDVFSCKTFDDEKALGIVKEMLGALTHSGMTIPRRP